MLCKSGEIVKYVPIVVTNQPTTGLSTQLIINANVLILETITNTLQKIKYEENNTTFATENR